MSGGHRRYKRRRSSESWPSGRSKSMRASTMEADDNDMHGGGQQRRLTRSSPLPVRQRSPDSRHPCPSWVVLNRSGARLDGDGFSGDRPTSATSRTSTGEEFSVTLELGEPPGGTPVLTVDWTRPSTTPMVPSADVIAAHRDVVLLVVTSYEASYEENTYQQGSHTDLFVYQASREGDSSWRRRPSLSLLTMLPSVGRTVIYWDLACPEAMGIMSCTSNDDSSPPPFVVAYLDMHPVSIEALQPENIYALPPFNIDVLPPVSIDTGSRSATVDAHLFRLGCGQWEVFKNLDVRGAVRDAIGSSDADIRRNLLWWTTNAVVPYGRRYMVWVDYYHGMILMDMSSQLQSSSSEKNLAPPTLQYVPLPVNMVADPEYGEFGGRGWPETYRRVCITRYGIKFVSIDTQHLSEFGIGNRDLLTWSKRFRITTWSLREDDDDYTWRKDVTMHEEEFWEALYGGDHVGLFPHVQPEFPVVDVDNPDVVFFWLGGPHRPKWMIEVDLRKRVLRAATFYSKERDDGLSGDAEAINSTRVSHYDPFTSELPR